MYTQLCLFLSQLSPSFLPRFHSIFIIKAFQKYQNVIVESSCSNKVKNEPLETGIHWPLRIKLTTDLRWDSLKISPSEELEEHILGNINMDSRRLLDAWIPIELSIYDVNISETCKVNLAKKESFWFELTPEKSCSLNAGMVEEPCYDVEKSRKEFSYSIEPFRQIKKRGNLNYGQEIGLRWSGSKSVNKLEFSVPYVPRLDF